MRLSGSRGRRRSPRLTPSPHSNSQDRWGSGAPARTGSRRRRRDSRFCLPVRDIGRRGHRDRQSIQPPPWKSTSGAGVLSVGGSYIRTGTPPSGPGTARSVTDAMTSGSSAGIVSSRYVSRPSAEGSRYSGGSPYSESSWRYASAYRLKAFEIHYIISPVTIV